MQRNLDGSLIIDGVFLTKEQVDIIANSVNKRQFYVCKPGQAPLPVGSGDFNSSQAANSLDLAYNSEGFYIGNGWVLCYGTYAEVAADMRWYFTANPAYKNI